MPPLGKGKRVVRTGIGAREMRHRLPSPPTPVPIRLGSGRVESAHERKKWLRP